MYIYISINLSFEQENCSDLQNMEMAPLQGAPRCAGSQVLPVPATIVTSCPPRRKQHVEITQHFE